MADDTAITHHKDGSVTATGDAVLLMRVKSIQLAIRSAARGMVLTRGMNMKRSLEMASEVTKKKYRGKADAERAMQDLQVWLDAMRMAIPDVVEK